MKRVLLIGGVGYIGSALYRHLDNDRVWDCSYIGRAPGNYEIDTVDLEWFGNYVNQNNIIVDYRNLTPEFLAKYDTVVMLAAFSSPKLCENSGVGSTFNNNVANFTHLLPKLREGQKFIYASSITVYQGLEGESDEERKIFLPPTNSYDFSKQDCDRIIQLYPQIEFYGLRLATVCGTSDNWRCDIMVNAMTQGAVFGGEIKLFNPHNHKPILYLGDLVRAIKTIIDCPQDHRGFYNLASYNGITEDIAEAVANTTNCNIRRYSEAEMHGSLLPTTAYDIQVSTKKFEQTFGFKFEGTTEHIASEILEKIDKMHPTKRVHGIKYE